MTLFQAPEYNPRRDQRRKQIIIIAVLFVLLLAYLGWTFRNWREERVVDHFFQAIEHKDYETAYAIWMADPNWKQHPEKFKNYPFGAFELDWGPTGEYGTITHHRIAKTFTPKGGGSGVIVVAFLNDRRQPVALWVEKNDHSMTYSPQEATVQP